MQPHYGQSSSENVTPSSSISPLASCKEVPPPLPSGVMVLLSHKITIFSWRKIILHLFVKDKTLNLWYAHLWNSQNRKWNLVLGTHVQLSRGDQSSSPWIIPWPFAFFASTIVLLMSSVKWSKYEWKRWRCYFRNLHTGSVWRSVTFYTPTYPQFQSRGHDKVKNKFKLTIQTKPCLYART